MNEVLEGLLADKQAAAAEAGDYRRFNAPKRMASSK
jgi:hypothetical protein